MARMGLAVVDRATCLPYAGREECRLCIDECKAAGYDAIEIVRQNVEVDANGDPVEDSGMRVPVVVAERCVGCGLCQMRCRAIHVKSRHALQASAIEVVAGPGREDRLLNGSYLARRPRVHPRIEQRAGDSGNPASDYLPPSMRE